MLVRIASVMIMLVLVFPANSWAKNKKDKVIKHVNEEVSQDETRQRVATNVGYRSRIQAQKKNSIGIGRLTYRKC